jgi:hypothetical protein
MMASFMAHLMAISTLAMAYPDYIGCDFRVIPTKSSVGTNVMTTANRIMGSPPVDTNDLVSTSKNGRTVTITFSNDFRMGLAHATAGKFTASQFSGTPNDSAARCTGTESMIYKRSIETTQSITWTAPIGVNSVTLSFASASGQGPISRTATTITGFDQGDESQVTGTLFVRITSGSCALNQLAPISDISMCGEAGRVLGLGDAATASSDFPTPEGCYYTGNDVKFSVNPANQGIEAGTLGYDLLCRRSASVAAAVAGRRSGQSAGATGPVIIGVVAVASFLLCAMVSYAVYKLRNRTEGRFEA